MSNNAVAMIQELRSLIEAEALNTEEGGTLSAPVVDALAKSGLFHLMVPAELGGMEADTDTIIDVLAEASYADGATGWSLMANVNSTAYVAYIAPEAARKVVATTADCAAGMFGPMGGQSTKVDGGFNIQGQYQFGSGSGHATYIGFGSFEMINGEMAPADASGMPPARCGFLPKDKAVMQGGWDVVGLSGTGSYDYVIPEQFVEEDYTFNLMAAQARSGGPMFHMGPVVLAAICHAGWGLGVARRALDEIKDIGNAGRARMGSAPMRDQQMFQRPFAKHTLALEAAEELNRKIYKEIMVALNAGEPMTMEMFERTRSAATYLTEVGEEAVTFAYQMAGSKGMRNPSVLQRCMRDIMVGGRHMFVDAKNYEALAAQLLAPANEA